MLKEIRPRYLEAVEESLNDTANLLAAQVELQVRNGEIRPELLQRTFDRARDRAFRARIYGILKTRTAVDVYVTNRKGIVVFDSTGHDMGRDFSAWNDVARSLRGEYGARSSRSDTSDPSSGALYVAAPIRSGGRIIGSLTVVKPKDSVTPFMELARRKFTQAGMLAASGMILLVLLLSLWITAPIQRLRRYVESLRESPETKIPLPQLGSGEVADLGRAFEEMRAQLESRAYIERYVQSLTHEIKSPLSAIRGAAELLQGRLKPADRRRFLENIEAESKRITEIVQRMLDLAAIESRTELRNAERVDVNDLTREILVSLESDRRARRLHFALHVPKPHALCVAERFLLRQAIENVVRNALDFSPGGGMIHIDLVHTQGWLELTITDEGPGVPEFAIPRVFDRFYSLARPDTGRKGTGLGLPFAREVMQLHRGDCTLESPVNDKHGTRVRLRWPAETSAPPQAQSQAASGS